MKCLFTGSQWLSEASNHRTIVGSVQQSKFSCNRLIDQMKHIISKDSFYFSVCHCREARREIYQLCRFYKKLHWNIE